MKQIILVLALISVSVTVKAQKKDPRFEGLESIVNQILKEWNVPGVSIAVVEKNKVLFTGGFGYRDFESKKPVTANTQFAIGSCTKAFTAALLSYEMKERNLDLDAPINSYLPELKFYTNELTANVTVRDLLCHRTGLPRNDFSWYSGYAASRDSLLHVIRYFEPNAPLRQSFQYNNYMYLVIGRLLEKLNGSSWEKLVQEKLFKPLTMSNSTTGLFTNDGDFSYGYVYKNEKLQKLDFFNSILKPIAPVGGIVSNATDMANWLLMWTNQGQFEGKEIISSNFYRQAISSQMIASANLPAKMTPDYYFFNYGLGWYTANYRGHYGVGHGGNVNGFSSFTSFLPTDSIGIFVSANQNNSEVPRILTNIIIDRMIGASYRDWNSLIKMQARKGVTEQDKNSKATKPSHTLADFSGTYKSDAYGTITINDDKDALTGTFNRWKLKIKHLHYNYFKFSINDLVFDGSESLKGEFSVSEDGTIGSLKMPFEDGVKEIVFNKQVTTPVIKEDLKKYTGDYDFNGAVVKIYLTEANVLKAIVPGQPEYELLYVKQDEFSLKGVKGISLKFDRDENGNIPSCLFIQPNGSFKVKRINNSKSENKDNKQGAAAKNEFLKYVGEYNMGGQTVKIYLKQEALMAKIPGQPEYTLVPANEDEFSIKGVSGYRVKFESNEKAEVIAFILTQPNGNVRAEKK